MEKVVAVRIDPVGDNLRVSGYVARQKNRGRVWSFEIPRKDKAQATAMVEEEEKKRKEQEEE